jgi:hypothetical protein
MEGGCPFGAHPGLQAKAKFQGDQGMSPCTESGYLWLYELLDPGLPPSSRTRIRLRAKPSLSRKPIDPSLSVMLLSRRVIDALARVFADVAFNGAAEKGWPELRRADDAADNSQSDYRRDEGADH